MTRLHGIQQRSQTLSSHGMIVGKNNGATTGSNPVGDANKRKKSL